MKGSDTKRLAVLVAIAVGCSPGFGQNSARYRTCNKTAMTQMEMNRCANEEGMRVDAELNGIYTKLLAELKKNPEAAAKVKAERDAWIKYRDAHIEAMYPEKDKQVAYGTIFPMEVDLLGAVLTRIQIKAVKELQHNFDETPK